MFFSFTPFFICSSSALHRVCFPFAFSLYFLLFFGVDMLQRLPLDSPSHLLILEPSLCCLILYTGIQTYSNKDHDVDLVLPEEEWLESDYQDSYSGHVYRGIMHRRLRKSIIKSQIANRKSLSFSFSSSSLSLLQHLISPSPHASSPLLSILSIHLPESTGRKTC